MNQFDTYYYNPTYFGYILYESSRSVYFKSLLHHKEFTHQSGTVKLNAFDKIESYQGDDESKVSAETIFGVDDYYLLGHYDKSEKVYTFRKFHSWKSGRT